MVREERPPCLRPGPRAAAQIARDGAFRNGDAEFQQFAMDPRSTPETILRRQSSNQISSGGINARSSRTSRATASASTNAFAMPPIDGGRLDQQQRLPPSGPGRSEEQPLQTVGGSEALMGTREDTELVAQGKHLEHEVKARRARRLERNTR